MSSSSFVKLKLLIWKNYLFQCRHKFTFLFEIFIPVVFCALAIIGVTHNPVVPKPSTRSTIEVDSLYNLRSRMNSSSSKSRIQNWMLCYSPKNRMFERLIQEIWHTENMDGYVPVTSSRNLATNLFHYGALAAIEFDYNKTAAKIKQLPKKLRYTIGLPSNLLTETFSEFQKRVGKSSHLLFPRVQTADFKIEFKHEVFFAIQHAVAKSYLKILSGVDMPDISLKPFHAKPNNNVFPQTIDSLIPFLLTLAFIFPVANSIACIVREKEKHLKEIMTVMGLSNWHHWIGWFIRIIVNLNISNIFIVLIFKIYWSSITGASLFAMSNWCLLFLFLFAYSIVTTMFCFMISSIASKSNTGAAIGCVVWFLYFAVYSFTLENYDKPYVSSKLIIFLFCNTAMAYGFNVINYHEQKGIGLQINNFWEHISPHDDLSVGLIICYFMATACFYLLIALYMESILSTEYSISRPWYFLFTKTFWCVTCQQKEEIIFESLKDNHYIEDEPLNNVAGIRTKNLWKIYNGMKIAVHGLTVNMYENNITVLLGHNGSGKTTLLSILAGMVLPNYGTAIINDLSILTEIDAVRKSLGFCPQYNMLFDELTIKEHLMFYSQLKGLSKSAAGEEVAKYSNLLKLHDQANILVSTLPEGMKRNLSICLALCGNSKIILCDEPTAGMDPGAKRVLWNIIKSEKKGRTVLVTTNSMDEADILGDRIAIISAGKLLCYGSLSFLNERLGLGYHLTCVHKEDCDSDKITSLLSKYIPNIYAKENMDSKLSYVLPQSSSNEFEEMFKQLDGRMEDLLIESYNISLTTLEDVLIKIGSEITKTILSNSFADCNLPPVLNKDTISLVSGIKLLQNQIFAMFNKKFYQTIRNRKYLILQMSIPILFLIITLFTKSHHSRFMDLSMIDLPYYTPKNMSFLETYSYLSRRSSSLHGRIAYGYRKLFGKELLTRPINPNLRSNINHQSRFNSNQLFGATIMDDDSSKLIAWFNSYAIFTAPISLNYMHNAIIKTHLGSEHAIELKNFPMLFSKQLDIEGLKQHHFFGSKIGLNLTIGMIFLASSFILAPIEERVSGFKLTQFLGGIKGSTFWITTFTWDMFIYLLIITLPLLIFLALESADGSIAPNEFAILLVLFVAFGFAFLPITYIASSFYSVPSSGFTRMALFYMITGLLTYYILYFMRENYHLDNVANNLESFLMIFPHFALKHSLNGYKKIATIYAICAKRMHFCKSCRNVQDLCQEFRECCEIYYLQWKFPGIGSALFYLFGTSIICFILLLTNAWDKILNFGCYCVKKLTDKRFYPKYDNLIDADVQKEKLKVLRMSLRDIRSHSLVLKYVTKVHGKRMAIKSASVIVNNKDCFGLLGANGAGKTTLLKILTGDFQPSFGKIWINGIPFNSSNRGKVFKLIGYCPQFNGLSLELTASETLEMFCMIHGIPKSKIWATALDLATVFGFKRNIDDKVKYLNAGNQRKLLVALAILGNSKIIFLDEPTTGMDPKGQRRIWNIIERIRESGKTILLSSHNMEECEVLCTRLTIMMNGEFKCLGTVQYLKERFAKGYNLIIRAKIKSNIRISLREEEPDMNPIKDYISTFFEGSVLQGEYCDILTYYVPSTTIKLSTMFGLMEKVKAHLNIESYSLSQTSLENVFLALSKH